MSVIDNLTSIFVPIHREGYPFIIIFFIITCLLWFVWTPLFLLSLVLTIWCIYFFRDPERQIIQDDKLVLSPADGKIVFLDKVVPPSELELGSEPMTKISIFMSVFSCHVNRSPIAGEIKKITYIKGKFLSAQLDKSSEDNERNCLLIEGEHGSIGVVQVAGLIARRIRCWRKENEILDAGKKIGMIRFGSRVDVYLPDEIVPQIAIGQQAVAGETILARVGGKQPHFSVE